ncbi:MAG: glycosyltransferase family 2 protein [Bacteroidales bacterium]|nr:glycosyltransferase family 2 protein [Bacteroidales bacterium]
MISVILPVYNTAAYLSACLDSVLAQTYRDIEVILVDDGSTDGSAEVCDDYACRDARVTVLHQENGGPSAARNRGLEIASGEYVAFIDSDDVVHQRYLEVLITEIERHHADIAQSPYQIVPESKRSAYNAERLKQPLSNTCKTKVLTTDEAMFSMLYQQGMADSSPCKLFRRSLFEGQRFPIIFRVYEDLYVMAQIYPRITRMVWVDVPTYFYFKQDSGTLNSISIRRKDAFEVLETLEAQFMVTGQPQFVRATRERRLSVAFNILRLLSKQPHTDANKAMAHRCCQHIKSLRAESIRDPRARLKNRITSLFSYFLMR